MADDPCAEFHDLLDREIEVRLQHAGAGWTQDKCLRAQRCLEYRALMRKKAEQSGLVRATWAGVIVGIIIASIGGLYAIRHAIKPLAIDAISYLRSIMP